MSTEVNQPFLHPILISQPAVNDQLTPVTGNESINTYNPQKNSGLFNKLTFDTRSLIYQAILGKRCFHILRKYRRLGHLLCIADSSIRSDKTEVNHIRSKCWGEQDLEDLSFSRRSDDPKSWEEVMHWRGLCREVYLTDGGILPFLLACKLIYSEAIGLLHSNNTFAFRDAQTVHLFFRRTPSHHLANLHHLYIETNYVEHSTNSLDVPSEDFRTENEWIDFWKTIQRLPALQTLEVKIVDCPEWLGMEYFVRDLWSARIGVKQQGDFGLLDPLRAFEGLDRFEIKLSSKVQGELRENEPFQVEVLEWWQLTGESAPD